jgi:outer membrane protein TolC
MCERRPVATTTLWLLLSLAGCAGPGALQRPPEPLPPAAWSNVAASTAPTNPLSQLSPAWWLALGDAQLDALQAQAQQTHLNTLRRNLAWRMGQLQARQAGLDEQPRLNLSLGSNASKNLQPDGGSTTVVNGVSVALAGQDAGWQTNYGANLGLSYEWDVWSRLSQATQAAQADADSRLEDLRDARALASTQVAEAYWHIAAIDAQQALLTEQQQLADEAVRIAQRRWAEGKIRALDVDTAISQQYLIRKRLQGSQVDRALQLQTLSQLLDQAPPAIAPGQAQLPLVEPTVPELGLPAQTLERRPDVRRARLGVDAALARSHSAEAARYPALNLSTGLNTSGNRWRDWFSQPLATLGLNLAIPLVDWRRLDAQRDLSHLALDDAALALRATVRQALVEVESALLERQRWQADWQAAQTQQMEKAKAETVAKQRLDAGAASRLDALQARQGRLEAELTLIDLRLRAWQIQLQLLKAMGEAMPS